ncbi:MAG: hypothetical protein WC702_00530 [Patescibacteria group bacterium]|jgi:hypothetical protein
MPENYTPSPIEAADKVEHEKKLEKELLKIQILAGKMVWNKARAEGKDISFSKAFEEQSDFFSKLFREIVIDRSEEETDQILDEAKTRVNEAFDNGHDQWLDRVAEVFDNLLEQWCYKKENTNRKERAAAGSISYGLKAGPPELEPFGIDSDDEVLELHLEEIYKREQKVGVKKAVLQDLQNLAVAIVDRMPQVKAVTGFSWLMEHPLVKQIGFQTIEGPSHGSRGGSTWLQFVDRNGNIHEQRLKQFLETGELPFKARFGFIPVVDFLQRYLPAERRGQIILRENRPGWREAKKLFYDAFQGIKDRWSDLSVEELKSLLEHEQSALAVLEEIGIKDQLVDLLVEARQAGKSLSEVRETLETLKLNQKLSDFLTHGKEYTVQIE